MSARAGKIAIERFLHIAKFWETCTLQKYINKITRNVLLMYFNALCVHLKNIYVYICNIVRQECRNLKGEVFINRVITKNN